MIYDITPPIDSSLAVWPGDNRPTREVLLDLARGDTVTLSTLRATVHLGAHADAPSHYGVGAPSIEARPVDLYLGMCQVMHTPVARGKRVAVSDMKAPIHAPRVLFRTDTYPDPRNFNPDFAALEPSLIEHLARHDVKLVGLDTPSVDLSDSKDLPSHQMCLRHDLAILEVLVLKDVPEGIYELIALPLKLVGFDASPVRAILRTVE